MVTKMNILFGVSAFIAVFLGASASSPGEVLKVREGKGFEVTCKLIAFIGGRPDIEFLKDGQPVEPSSRANITGSVLKMDPAQLSDAGVYSCKVGDEVREVGTVIVLSDISDSEALGIALGVFAGCLLLSMLIIGAILYRRRYLSNRYLGFSG